MDIASGPSVLNMKETWANTSGHNNGLSGKMNCETGKGYVESFYTCGNRNIKFKTSDYHSEQ